jgi:hypothetical protein
MSRHPGMPTDEQQDSAAEAMYDEQLDTPKWLLVKRLKTSEECRQNLFDALTKVEQQRDRLRAALVLLVGVDSRAELEEMETTLRLAPAPAEDKAAAIDGIHALLSTLPDVASVVPPRGEEEKSS